jgi:hypothetical protein
MARSGRAILLQVLAIDGLCSLVGLSRAAPQLIGALRTCQREGLVTVIRPALKPTGYSRRAIPTDIAALTSTGLREAGCSLGRPVAPVSLRRELEHRLGVGELRTKLRIPLDAWMSAAELHATRLAEPAGHIGHGLPDGLSDIYGMRLALEYDHGRYTALQVRFKLQQFMHLADGAVWAAPTTRRVQWLRRLGCEHALVVPLPLGVWERPVARPSAPQPC